MFSIRKWLSTAILATAFSSTALASETAKVQEPNIAYAANTSKVQLPPKELTLEDHAIIYNQEIVKEIGRKRNLLRYTDEFNLMQGYIQRRSYDPFAVMSQEDSKRVQNFMEDVMQDSAEEFINDVEWTSKIKRDLSKKVSYEVYVKGGKIKTPEYESPELKEEDRLEKIEQKGVTRVGGNLEKYFGEGYEMHSGFKPYLREGNPHLKAYARIEPLKLFGIQFKKLNLEVNSQQQTKVTLQKLLDRDLYTQFNFEKSKEDGYEESISLIKDLTNPRAKLSLTAGRAQGEDYFVRIGYASVF